MHTKLYTSSSICEHYLQVKVKRYFGNQLFAAMDCTYLFRHSNPANKTKSVVLVITWQHAHTKNIVCQQGKTTCNTSMLTLAFGCSRHMLNEGTMKKHILDFKLPNKLSQNFSCSMQVISCSSYLDTLFCNYMKKRDQNIMQLMVLIINFNFKNIKSNFMLAMTKIVESPRLPIVAEILS